MLLIALGGCGVEESKPTISSQPPRETVITPSPSREEADRGLGRTLALPPGLPSCRTTEGRIVYVERVDPDGDGDAHFVIADPQGITLPGLTAIDVRKGLRPIRCPAPAT